MTITLSDPKLIETQQATLPLLDPATHKARLLNELDSMEGRRISLIFDGSLYTGKLLEVSDGAEHLSIRVQLRSGSTRMGEKTFELTPETRTVILNPSTLVTNKERMARIFGSLEGKDIALIFDGARVEGKMIELDLSQKHALLKIETSNGLRVLELSPEANIQRALTRPR